VVIWSDPALAKAFGAAVDLIVKGSSAEDALAQAIHDASVHLGAGCVYQGIGPVDPSGAADGANKGRADITDDDEDGDDYNYDGYDDEDGEKAAALAFRVKALRR
jgi:hypothetical protein